LVISYKDIGPQIFYSS